MNRTRRHRPFGNIDCQSLIGLGDNLFAWLRSQNIMGKWTKKFVVLYKGYVYIFKNENATNHYRDMSFSLQGYKSIELPILKDSEVIWVMKLLHADDVKSKCFATSSEKELHDWASNLQEGITFANNVQIRQSYAVWPQGTTSEPDIYEDSRRYQGGRLRYDDLSTQPLQQAYSQMTIHPSESNDDLSTQTRQSSQQSNLQMKNRSSNITIYEDVIKNNAAPFERPPMLPPRPQKEHRTPNNYIELENPPVESESSSDFEEDVDADENDYDYNDDSSVGYCIYENMGDVTYYTEPGETSDIYDEFNLGSSSDDESVPTRNVQRKTKRRTLGKIGLSQGSRYSVISKRSYRAQTSDELNFPKEMKFDVVGQATKRWLIGEIDGKKGFFPVEYVKKIQLHDNESVTKDLTYMYSVIALRPYEGQSHDEISFRKEDKFNVVGQESERWLVGEVNGNKGLFPAEFVKKCQIILSKPLRKTKRLETKASTKQSTYCVIATKSYKAKSSLQISFQKEDKFIVVGEKSSGWLLGEINGKKGLFPSECVKVKLILDLHLCGDKVHAL
ncbi:unnamed protein product [Mytilus coruscus]|uniref:Uncharacterized protein n=1 Tax=Mytilus coruscus TaxID=42192 RepID=A0A6J8EUW1_MYTCO|nr:unnamed protein product [Mytilus coruscus]